MVESSADAGSPPGFVEGTAPSRDDDEMLHGSRWPWPDGAVFLPDGLEIAGVSARALAQKHGTPLLVIDEGDVRARCRMWAALWPQVFYAVEAFTAHALLRIAIESGLDLLAASSGEAETCLRAGVPGERISLHGENKSDEDLRFAVRAGLGLVVVEDAEELPRVANAAQEAGVVQDVLIRVMPDPDVWKPGSAPKDERSWGMGVPLSDAVGLAKSAASTDGLRFAGFHAHLGLELPETEPYIALVDRLIALVTLLRNDGGIVARLVDIGGGFGVARAGEPALSVDELARAVLARVSNASRDGGFPVPSVAVEPGRAISGPAGLTLCRVAGVKTVAGRRLVAVDGGIWDDQGAVVRGAHHDVAIAGESRKGRWAPATIVERGNGERHVLAEDVALPADLAPGELLAFAQTGAYTYSLANTYRRIGRPSVVAVRAGESEEWLRREDAADLDRLEIRLRPREHSTQVPDGLEIRPARPRDARAFVEFWKAIVAEGRRVRSEQVQRPARTYRSRFRRSWTGRGAQLVAVEGDRVVGHLSIAREDHPVTTHVATLGMAVAADRRGSGIGSALMAHAFQWARSVGVEKVLLSVYPHNTAAISLYRKFGFVEEGRLARHSRKSYGYEDELLMSCWLGSRSTA
jgi:diaminopimelate decarboxylase